MKKREIHLILSRFWNDEKAHFFARARSQKHTDRTR